MIQKKRQKRKSEPWINQKRTVLAKLDLSGQLNLFFLYGFLGDRFDIKRELYLENLVEWKKLNPKYVPLIIRNEYDEIDKFVQNNFSPEWSSLYLKYNHNIQRCDLIRYLLMFKYGGIYADLDLIPKTKISKITQAYPTIQVFFGYERYLSDKECERINKQKIRGKDSVLKHQIGNFWFLARKPNHPIWLDILALAKERAEKSNYEVTSHYDIIYTTGPDLVTEAVTKNIDKYHDVMVIPNYKFVRMFNHKCTASWREKDIPRFHRS